MTTSLTWNKFHFSIYCDSQHTTRHSVAGGLVLYADKEIIVEKQRKLCVHSN